MSRSTGSNDSSFRPTKKQESLCSLICSNDIRYWQATLLPTTNRSQKLSRASWHRLRSLTSTSGLSRSRKPNQPPSRSQQSLTKSERLKPPSPVGRFRLSILRERHNPKVRL